MPINTTYLDERIATIQNILQKRPKEQFGKANLQEAVIVLGNLNEEEKEYVRNSFANDWEAQSLVDDALEMKPLQADYSKSKTPNTPYAVLMEDFRNPKSRRVQAARKELLARYEYLDPLQQLAIRLMFLNSKNKTDRERAIRLCMERWDGAELDTVLKIWEDARIDHQRDLWYWCSRLVIRHCDIQFLRTHEEQLTTMDEDFSTSLYYHYWLHLGKTDPLKVDKRLMRLSDYYRLLYHMQSPLNEDEWLRDLFTATAEVYFHSLTNCHYRRFYTHKDEFFPQVVYHTLPPGDGYVHKECYHWSLVTEIKTIRDILQYGVRMGAKRVMEFLDYAHRVDDIIQAMDDDTLNNTSLANVWYPYRDTSKEPDLHTTFTASEPLRNCCPSQYRSLFDSLA